MSDHEQQLENVALYVLGALPAGDASDTREHIAQCAQCEEEYAATHELGGMVGYAAELRSSEHELRLARLRRRIMNEVASLDTAKNNRNPAGVMPILPHAAQSTGLRAWQTALAAAGLGLAIVGYLGMHEHQGRLAAQAQVDALQREPAAEAAQLQTLAGLVAQQRILLRATLAPDAKHYGMASGDIVQNHDRLVLNFIHLPPLPSGHVYQAWTLPRHALAMTPQATFVMNPRGGLTVITVLAQRKTTAAVGVTIEPAGGSKAPTTKPLFVQVLS